MEKPWILQLLPDLYWEHGHEEKTNPSYHICRHYSNELLLTMYAEFTDLLGQKACRWRSDGLIPYKRGVGTGSIVCPGTSNFRQLLINGMFCMPRLAQASPKSSRNRRHIQWSTSAIDTCPIISYNNTNRNISCLPGEAC